MKRGKEKIKKVDDMNNEDRRSKLWISITYKIIGHVKQIEENYLSLTKNYDWKSKTKSLNKEPLFDALWEALKRKTENETKKSLNIYVEKIKKQITKVGKNELSFETLLRL